VFAIGSSLREARDRQGLELVDAESATKIRAKYLRALEEESFDLLPAQTYVKGFLRSYADYLGLDGQLYVDEFNSRFASGEDDLPTVASPRRPRARSGRQVESAVVLVALAGIAAITALVVVAWQWGGSPAERPSLVTPPASPQPPASKRSGDQWAALRVRAARGDSWIRVRRKSPRGKQLFSGILARGEERTFTGPRLFVLVGDPQNLTVRLGGKRARLPAGKHRLTVTPRRIRPTGA
jgi:hypothetical protein